MHTEHDKNLQKNIVLHWYDINLEKKEKQRAPQLDVEQNKISKTVKIRPASSKLSKLYGH